MLIKEAKKITGSLSMPGKLPCKAFSISPANCITGQKLSKVKGSVCHNCYAKKGNYKRYAATMEKAWTKRETGLKNKLWTVAISEQIKKDSFFRWHDSGDLQSVSHLKAIAAVCRNTPNTLHWLPTREYQIIKEYLIKHKIPNNLIIRYSAHMVGQTVNVPLGIYSSSVNSGVGFRCKAPNQGNKCLDCRACWDKSCNNIDYKKH